jgi:hypothetical protein
VAAVAVAGTLLPLAAVNAVDAGRRLGSLGVAARVDFLTDGREGRIRRALRGDHPLYRALVEHTPESAWIAVRTPMTRERHRTLVHLRNLLYPRRIDYLHAVAGGLDSGAGRPVFVLDLERDGGFPGAADRADERWRPVVRRPRFALWERRSAEP